MGVGICSKDQSSFVRLKVSKARCNKCTYDGGDGDGGGGSVEGGAGGGGRGSRGSSQVLCEFFRYNACAKGANCKFSHDLAIERKVISAQIQSPLPSQPCHTRKRSN